MDYRKLTRLSAVFLVIPGLLALLMPAMVWDLLAGRSEMASADPLSLELLRVIGAFFIGCGIPTWFSLAEIEVPVEQRRATLVQFFVAFSLILAFVHMAMTTTLDSGVIIPLVWTAIPLVLNSRAILSGRDKS
jgi:hypothetical protein